ncbi:uncharacterized protein [Sinocyclocheilus grahami]|uniref:uncharacterized protein n=1 Tax=Sinocyclocheilus grahami TaxID=75366 RepID=UPI0007AC7F1C|nr:PREDICTED: uncharacterized protein LOC107573202 [Sinocyclocheilus grahami]
MNPWNLVNKHGQVLVSVLTAAEGHRLDAMAAGLMKCYRKAGEAAPKRMYVDRDCCSQHGQSRVKVMFSEWDELVVHLDIWHFIRRFAAGVMTEAHPLYGIFMARLSMCIFQWDPEDAAALRRAKEGKLAAKKTGHISERVVSACITRRELALHCRRRTRGVDETTRLIGSLIDLLDSADGKDTLGFPLLDHEWIQQILKEQQKHEPVPVMRIFMPMSLRAWNDDRMEDAIKGASSIWSFGSAMKEAVDQLSQTVFGKPWDECYRPLGAYSG